MQKIILASSSPRRKQLLRQIGLPFSVVVSSIDEEKSYHLSAEEMVMHLSKEKAKKVANEYPDAVIIGADTTVVLNKKVIVKPISKEDAKRILTQLSGKKHTVITGITVIYKDKVFTDAVVTDVYMRKITQKEIEAYIATEEPMDKAGGYGIQEKGGLFVEKINGDYSNVVGLPIGLLTNLLQQVGVNVLDFWKKQKDGN